MKQKRKAWATVKINRAAVCLMVAAGLTALPGAPRAAAAEGAPSRKIVMVTYPEDHGVKVAFQATKRLPGAVGRARVRRRRGVTEIELEVKQLQPAILFGGDFNTYVLWTISPEGMAINAGELIFQGPESKLKTTTPLRSFAMLLTAEPHFLPRRPSRFVVLENSDTGLGEQKGVSGSPFEYADFAEDYKYERDSLTGTSETKGELRTERYQAIVAVRFAEEAGAQRWAPAVFAQARTALSTAQRGFAQGMDPPSLALFARQAVRLAVEAKNLAVERAAAAALAAERQAHREEIARLQREKAQAEAAAARARDEAKAAREAERKARAELAQAQQMILRANQEADELARLKAKAEQQALAAQNQAAGFYIRLQNALSRVAEIRETERGLVVNLPDILFDSGKSRLRPSAREVLSRIAGVLLVAPEYHLSIEGHTDSTGRAAFNQRLSERRAESVRDYLIQAQISPALMTVRGFGESRPVASNRTAAGRQKNRRVEIVIEGLTRPPGASGDSPGN